MRVWTLDSMMVCGLRARTCWALRAFAVSRRALRSSPRTHAFAKELFLGRIEKVRRAFRFCLPSLLLSGKTGVKLCPSPYLTNTPKGRGVLKFQIPEAL